MTDTVYMLEEICCRGHIEKRHTSFPVVELTEFLDMLSVTSADEMDEALDTYMERYYPTGESTQASRDTCSALYNFVQCFELDNDITTEQLIRRLLDEGRVGLTMEESIAGYGLTKEGAKLAFAEIDSEEDGW